MTLFTIKPSKDTIYYKSLQGLLKTEISEFVQLPKNRYPNMNILVSDLDNWNKSAMKSINKL